MTYSGTDKNIWAVSNTSKKPLLATHYSFDKAHMTTSQDNIPLYAAALHQAGYSTADIPDEAEPKPSRNKMTTTSPSPPVLKQHEGTENRPKDTSTQM